MTIYKNTLLINAPQDVFRSYEIKLTPLQEGLSVCAWVCVCVVCVCTHITVQAGILSSHGVLIASVNGGGDQSPKMALNSPSPPSRHRLKRWSAWMLPWPCVGLGTCGKSDILGLSSPRLKRPGSFHCLSWKPTHPHEKFDSPAGKRGVVDKGLKPSRSVEPNWAPSWTQLQDGAQANTVDRTPASSQNCEK